MIVQVVDERDKGFAADVIDLLSGFRDLAETSPEHLVTVEETEMILDQLTDRLPPLERPVPPSNE